MTNRLKNIQVAVLLPATFLFLLFSSGCGSKQSGEEWVYLEGATMGTSYHIKMLTNLNEEEAKHVVDSTLIEVNRALSTYDTTSFISLFNRKEIPLNLDSLMISSAFQHFVKVWTKSVGVYLQTNGAFDPTASELFNLWGFGEEKRQNFPSQHEVDAARNHVPFRYLSLYSDLNEIVYPPVNFNAVAKGYGVDVVMEALVATGMTHGMVEIGGEVSVKGLNPQHQAWKIGINRPFEGASVDDYAVVKELTNSAMATSGNYRQFFYHDGQKYSHTIDPRTGYPVQNEVLSTTIVANECAIADALATAGMVVGVEGLRTILRESVGVKAILIVVDDALPEGYRIVELTSP